MADIFSVDGKSAGGVATVVWRCRHGGVAVPVDETPGKNAQISRFSSFFQVSLDQTEEPRDFDDIMGGGP